MGKMQAEAMRARRNCVIHLQVLTVSVLPASLLLGSMTESALSFKNMVDLQSFQVFLLLRQLLRMAADTFLWREKNRSAGVLESATAIWILFESPPRIPEVAAQEKCVVEIASARRFEVNRALAILKDIASGRELERFLIVIAGLWIVSIVGSWFNFLTLFYIMFILLFTVPVFYEKYEDQVNAFGEKAMVELKKHSMWC